MSGAQPMQVDVIDLDDDTESESSSIMIIDDPSKSAPTTDDTRHVTRFDFKRQIAAFLEEIGVQSAGDRPEYIPQDAFDLAFDGAFKTETTLSAGSVLEGLSRILGIPGLTELFIKHFRPILLDLIARWVQSSSSQTTSEEWERKLFVVAELAQHVPEAWSYVQLPCP